MKKLSVLFVAGLAVLNGCTSQEDPIPPFEPAERATETTYTRSVADAIAIADAFLDAGNDKAESRAGRTPKVAAILGATSRSESDTLLYSVNYGEDDGFVIVSAKATPEPVLAYVEKGSYNGETTQNPGFEGFIAAARTYSESFVGFDTTFKRPYTIVKDIFRPAQVDWGQNYPEGLLFPNGVCGCAVTAIAEACAILEKPASVALTYPSASRSTLTLEWSEIKKHVQSSKTQASHLTTCSAEEEAHFDLATLCRHLDRLFYESSGSGSEPASNYTIDEVYNTLVRLFGKDKVGPRTSLGTNYEALFDKLYNNKCVALMFGSTEDYSQNHVWLCEAGRYYELHTLRYDINGRERVNRSYYFYYNWGENGDYNGYFLGGEFNTGKGIAEEELPTPLNPFWGLGGLSRADNPDYGTNVTYIIIYK
ncbi:MAG: Spi family protease inhibitor [Muribaculaceae bacterium]|nr:Spi family protease inhibitor [Muribaculaceae bacterium]